MEYQKTGDKIVMRLDRGTEILGAIKDVCEKENISAAWLSGLGATSCATVGFWNSDTREYEWKTFNDELEITNFTGNVSQLDGETALHIHITLADRHHQALGGHLKEGIVGATCEVRIEVLMGTLKRAHDDQTGLNLLDIS